MTMIECKATRTPLPSMAATLIKVRDAFKEKRTVKSPVQCVLIHRKGTMPSPETLVPGVKAMEISAWIDAK